MYPRNNKSKLESVVVSVVCLKDNSYSNSIKSATDYEWNVVKTLGSYLRQEVKFWLCESNFRFEEQNLWVSASC